MAVRAGVQLGVSLTSSMSHFFFSRENRVRRLLVAVRAGVQLGMYVTRSLSAKEYVRITHQRGAMFPKKLAQGHAACGACVFLVLASKGT